MKFLTRPLSRLSGLGVTRFPDPSCMSLENSESSFSGFNWLFRIREKSETSFSGFNWLFRTREKSGSSVTGLEPVWLGLMCRTRASATFPFRLLYSGETSLAPDLPVKQLRSGETGLVPDLPVGLWLEEAGCSKNFCRCPFCWALKLSWLEEIDFFGELDSQKSEIKIDFRFIFLKALSVNKNVRRWKWFQFDWKETITVSHYNNDVLSDNK